MAMDAGTTSARCILFNHEGMVCAMAQRELAVTFPKEGWVEQDAGEIWEAQLAVCREALASANLTGADIAAIGIANQRETTIVWDRQSGEPIGPAIVWQCRRTADKADELKRRGLEEEIRRKTGLIVDAYFSATKLQWILEQDESIRARAERGELLFGTVESWLIWNLTGGTVHCTEYSNAARTMLFNIHTFDWDEDILRELQIPRAMLPKAVPSSGKIAETTLFGAPIPIAGAAGDQQAALFGQTCFEPGEVKNTYGTGCFLLMNTGTQPVESKNGLLTTIAWGLDGTVSYALEGSIFVAGAAIQWLRDELGLLHNAAESEELAYSIENTGGVYLVPAFVGLGAPYWDPYARGTLVGMTRGTGKAQIVRAALESVAYQTADVLEAMQDDAAIALRTVKVDGGASRNNFLMEFQSDIIGASIVRPQCVETTALGAAYLAGLATGYWSSQQEIRENLSVDRTYSPKMAQEERAQRLYDWHRAVQCAGGWAVPQKNKKI
jgi:glycerol kinase